MARTPAPTPGTDPIARPRPALSRAIGPLNALVERFIPSALVFAMVLTVIVMAGAIVLTDSGPTDVVMAWGSGLNGLLAFTTQMALVLLLGFILAHTGPVRALLCRLAATPRGRVMPYVFVALVTCLSSLFTWGLGVVVGAVMATEVAAAALRRGEKLHFPLLVAGGYTGMAVWHMGYSGSAPLTAATPDSFIASQIGTTLPLSDTIFAGWNMITAGLAVFVTCTIFAMLAPRTDDGIQEMPRHQMEEPSISCEVKSPADRLDASRWVTLIPGLLLLVYLVLHVRDGGSITLDMVNWTFLTLVLLLVANPFTLIELTRRGAGNVGEILLQFPLYAGIMGIMSGTGLIRILSDWFVAVSTPETFGLLAFLSASLVNFFVPSGGGQAAVQGPVLLDAARELGVAPGVAVMALSYGDQVTNLVQPFWALPLLAIAKLRIRDILGYTAVLMIALMVVYGGALLIIGPNP